MLMSIRFMLASGYPGQAVDCEYGLARFLL